MSRFGWRALAVLAAALSFASPSPASAQQAVPPLRARVTDLTGTLSATEQQTLESKLASWEQQTTNQLAVLIVPTTQPETIEEYGIRVAEAWKLGQKGKDNGALLLVAKNDRRMRIEVGYGLEGDLPDVTARRIIGDTIAPYFAKGQFAAGIDAGVDRIIAAVSGAEPPPPPKAQTQRRMRSGGMDYGNLILFLLIGVTVIGAILRSILGKVGGGLAGAGIAGGAVWLFAGSLAFAAIAGIVAFVLIALVGIGGRGGPGMWIPSGGGGWSGGGGFGGGGGGFSGGGGGFGGGGSSGGW